MTDKTRDFLDYVESESEKKKDKIAKILAIGVIIASILIGIGFATGNTSLVIALGVINVLFGPLTLFFYLREVKRGVFSAEAEEDEA